MTKRRKRLYVGFMIFAFISVFSVFQWVRPMVMEMREQEAIELLEFQEYTNIEYVSSNGWNNKMEFRVEKDNKPMTVHITMGDGGTMTVGP